MAGHRAMVPVMGGHKSIGRSQCDGDKFEHVSLRQWALNTDFAMLLVLKSVKHSSTV